MKITNKKEFEKYCEDEFVDGDTTNWLWASIELLLKNKASAFVEVEIEGTNDENKGKFLIKVPLMMD